MKIIFPLALVALLGTYTSVRAADGEVISIKNAGFEEPFVALPAVGPDKKAQITGLLAEGWNDNSDWADITVEYSKDADSPHAGQSSQKVEITRVGSGAVQVIQHIDFQANHQYIFHVWMKGTPGTSVSLQLRKASEPYTTYASTDARMSEEWQEYTVNGAVADDGPGFLLLLASRPMTFWIDEVQLEDLTASGVKK